MSAQPDFRDAGEDFLEHFGKLGMKWGHRNASDNYESVSTSDSNSRPTSDPSMDFSYATTAPQKSQKGKYIALAVLGVAGAVLIANTPMAKPYVKRAVENIKPMISKMKITDVPKQPGGLPLSTMPKAPGLSKVVNAPVKYAGFRDFPKPPVKYAGFNSLRPLAGNKNVFPKGGLPLSSMPKAPMPSGFKSFFKNAGGLPLSSMPKAPIAAGASFFKNAGGLPLSSMPKLR